jgi:hypothetical protein
MKNKGLIILLATVLYFGTMYSQVKLTRQALRLPTPNEVRDAMNF